ncbi:hypothetical protein BBOV_III003985 [Babesia bovis T2Bo]|uniref:hypothetical protein n=1 Tax=Babesia bovis T2Bo TaxID=484906 RepID=UPI001C34E7B8|nr:hypothetical protein BBOV_III003985 [Babesia bovis T2Bo]KAG6440010.1 hypothetical protein BBOV_III003985 [Babesia bovis T2Bo]
MAKKNHRTAIQKRYNIVKKQMMDEQRRRAERNRLKQLCHGITDQLRSISVDRSKEAVSDNYPQEVVMAVAKPQRRGCNLIRDHPDEHVVTARRKKVLKQAMKRRRKIGT